MPFKKPLRKAFSLQILIDIKTFVVKCKPLNERTDNVFMTPYQCDHIKRLTHLNVCRTI